MSSNPVDDLVNHPGLSIETILASGLNSGIAVFNHPQYYTLVQGYALLKLAFDPTTLPAIATEFKKLEHTRLLNIFHHREKLIEKFVDIQLSTDSDVLVNPLELKRKFNEAVDARHGGLPPQGEHTEGSREYLTTRNPVMTYGQQMQLMIAMSDWKVVDRYLGLPFGDTEEIWNRRENMKAQLFRDIMAARAARRFPLTKPVEDRKKAMELVDRGPCLSGLGKEVMKEKMSKDSWKTFMEWYLYGLPKMREDGTGLSGRERSVRWDLIWRAWGVQPQLENGHEWFTVNC